MAPKAFDVLRYLVEHAGRLVTQQELLDALWPDTFVQPEILRKYILEIRKVLKDPPKNPLFIETHPKRGYQFIARIAEETHTSAPRPAAQVESHLVGREAPLAELNTRLGAVRRSQRQVVFITGEGGIGKTTLLNAFENEVDTRIARGQCVEGFGGKEAYYPVLEAFGQLIHGAGGDRVVQTLAAHAPTWLSQFPAAVKAEGRETLQREILGATRDRMVREVCEVLERLTADEPLVMILEDLQWVDDSTLDLISAIARRRAPARLMLLGTYRNVDVILSRSPLKELKQDLLIHHLCHEISPQRLTAAQIEQYLSTEGLPCELAGMIHRRSDGNPMFMVAVVDQMREKGLLVSEDGQWRLTVPEDRIDPGVPQTLQQMLEIQIERLGAKELRLLRAASVAGQRFSAWAVSAMLEIAAPEVEETCGHLAAQQQFLRSAGSQELGDGSESPQYEFKHALYREVLYRQLPATQLRQLHARLAEQIEAVSTSAEQAMASELALHFEEGRSYPQAVRYLILTAVNARRRYAHDDSIRLLRHALDLLPHIAPEAAHQLKIQILERISDALYAQGEMLQSADVDQAVVDQAAQHGFVVAQVNSLTRLARALAFVDPDRCIAVCERAVTLSRTQDDPLLQARSEMLAACWRIITHGWRKEDAAICASARESIRLSDEVPAYYEILYAHVQYIQGDYQGAYETAKAGIPKSIENDSLVVYLSAHSSLAQALLQLGRLGELLEVLNNALDVAEKNRNAPWVGIFQATLGWVRLQCRDVPGAGIAAGELLREYHDQPAGQVQTMAMLTMAWANLEQGSVDAALATFREASEGAGHFFLDWYWRRIARLGLANAHLKNGDVAAAGKEAELFLPSALATADPGLKALVWDLTARIALARGENGHALECVNRGLEGFEVPVMAWKVHTTAADCYQAAGDSQAAERHQARAAAILLKLADSLPAGEPLRQSLLSTSSSL